MGSGLRYCSYFFLNNYNNAGLTPTDPEAEADPEREVT
jgi:hypothetical protein